MKIKQSRLQEIIKEELDVFKKNQGIFPDETNEQIMNEMKSDVQQMYSRLVSNIGAEKLLEEILKDMDNRFLKNMFENLLKRYGIRY